MRSPTPVRALALLCALAVTLPAHARPLSRRLPQWLDALLAQCDAKSVACDSITLSVPDDIDAKADQAHVEVRSPERFWRLAPLVELRSGEATMKNVSEPGGPRRSEVAFEVALEPSTIREADVEKLRTAAEDLGALAEQLAADAPVKVVQLLASRPAPITLFGRAAHRLPVRFTLSGPRAAVLSRLAQLPAALPFAYLRSLSGAPGAELTAVCAANLLVKAAAPQTSSTPAAELARVAGEKLTVAGADVKVVISSPPNADTTILAVKGTARDLAAARAVLQAAVALPGLRAFDELGWKNAGGVLQLTGLLQFGP